LFKLAIRPLLVLVVFAVALQAVSRVFAFGIDGEAAHLARLFLREVQRRDALEQRAQEIAESEQIRSAAIQDFIAGRLTLAQTMEQYREAQQVIEEDRQGLVPHYRKPETKEALCRQVCAWIWSTLSAEHASQEVASVHLRLEKELKELFPAQDIDPYLNPSYWRSPVNGQDEVASQG
jgi:hypothetical protein